MTTRRNKAALTALAAGVTLSEIATRYGRARSTVSTHWSRHPQWPTAIGQRGLAGAHVYDPNAVDLWVQTHITGWVAEWTPDRLYTLSDIAAKVGVTASTLRTSVKNGRLPPPDDTSRQAHRWFGSTIAPALARRSRHLRRT